MVRILCAVSVAVGVASCSGPAPAPTSPNAPAPALGAGPEKPAGNEEPAGNVARAAAPSLDSVAVSSLGEVEARLVLAEMFRDAGYRILYDVEISVDGAMLAVDGFDPDKRVGYEYVAPAERKTAAQARRVGSATTTAVLVLEPSNRADLRAAAAAFLADRAAQRAATGE